MRRYKNLSVKKVDISVSEKIAAETGIAPIVAKILYTRGVRTKEEALGFLDVERLSFHSPFLMKDMDKAVERIKKALEKKERICIYGDYDVDGVTATTALYKYLIKKGANCSYFIPERITEGYGLNKEAIKNLASNNDLLITVDTGITAVEEIELANSLGMDVVVTDHHSCRPTLPNAVAVINPHREDCPYPFEMLAGVGVVFKLLCALEDDENTEMILDEYSDIVAIGTIADVMPMVDENRLIVKHGISRLSKTKNIGLRALMKNSGIICGETVVKKINTTTVGFVIAPRINAAGRIASATLAAELLLANTEAEAEEISERLCDINRMRQDTEKQIFDEAVLMTLEGEYMNDSVLVLANEGWHQGVIGVVASKITERFGRPSILISLDGEIGKGSGRSVTGFNLTDALTACSTELLEYGGHELAAGLSVSTEKLDEFRKKINEYAKNHHPDEAEAVLEVDCEVDVDEINYATFKAVSSLEPFGPQNPTPLFVLKGVRIHSVMQVGGGKHTKFRVDTRNGAITAMYFGMKFDDFKFAENDECDIVFSLDLNEYNGIVNVQMLVREVYPSERTIKWENAEEEKYLRRFDKYSGVPNIEEFRETFKHLTRYLAGKQKKLCPYMMGRIIKVGSRPIGYYSFMVILDVLEETDLAKVKRNENEYIVKLNTFSGKTNLDESVILNKIRSLE